MKSDSNLSAVLHIYFSKLKNTIQAEETSLYTKPCSETVTKLILRMEIGAKVQKSMEIVWNFILKILHEPCRKGKRCSGGVGFPNSKSSKFFCIRCTNKEYDINRVRTGPDKTKKKKFKSRSGNPVKLVLVLKS